MHSLQLVLAMTWDAQLGPSSSSVDPLSPHATARLAAPNTSNAVEA